MSDIEAKVPQHHPIDYFDRLAIRNMWVVIQAFFEDDKHGAHLGDWEVVERVVKQVEREQERQGASLGNTIWHPYSLEPDKVPSYYADGLQNLVACGILYTTQGNLRDDKKTDKFFPVYHNTSDLEAIAKLAFRAGEEKMRFR